MYTLDVNRKIELTPNERRKNNTIKGAINEANYSELQNWRA